MVVDLTKTKLSVKAYKNEETDIFGVILFQGETTEINLIMTGTQFYTLLDTIDVVEKSAQKHYCSKVIDAEQTCPVVTAQ